MTTSPAAPAWAIELVRLVCDEAGVQPPGTLAWRRRRGEHSTGVTRHGERLVAVRAGGDPTDQRLTLLHELAHWVEPHRSRRRGRRSVHHGELFYARAFALYRRHGLTDTQALALEAARYPSSLRHAVRLGIAGASDALDARRSELRARGRGPWRVIVPEHAIRLQRDGRWTVCAVCRQRIVGPNLARLRRRRAAARHVLLSRA